MLDLMRMDGNDPDTIHFPADARAVAVAVAAAHTFCARHRLGDEAEAKLAIVVEELVTNLVEHGGAPDAPIDLRLARRGAAVEIGLADRGARFDPRDAVTSDLPPERGGGAGILLVLAWARIESYRSHQGINQIELTMPLAAEG